MVVVALFMILAVGKHHRCCGMPRACSGVALSSDTMEVHALHCKLYACSSCKPEHVLPSNETDEPKQEVVVSMFSDTGAWGSLEAALSCADSA